MNRIMEVIFWCAFGLIATALGAVVAHDVLQSGSPMVIALLVGGILGSLVWIGMDD